MKEGISMCAEPTTESEIKELYLREIPIFKAWGQYVIDNIAEQLSKTQKLDEFLKIPVSVRIKDVDSLIAKALHRKKNYSCPYHDIEDKVGIRFVVLLTEDTDIVCNIIKQISKWSCSEDQDFKKNREEYPESFPYESCHFVVKSLEQFTYQIENSIGEMQDITIPEGIPCEIQVRSLLQHAYAELSHETLYKKKIRKEETIKRFLARSMALVESADYFFIQVKDKINEESEFYGQLLDVSSNSYPPDLLALSNEEANITILDLLLQKDAIKITDISCLCDYLQQNKEYLDAKIRLNHSYSFIYRIPSVLLLYYLVNKKPSFLRDNRTILPEDISIMLYTDLGTSFIQE